MLALWTGASTKPARPAIVRLARVVASGNGVDGAKGLPPHGPSTPFLRVLFASVIHSRKPLQRAAASVAVSTKPQAFPTYPKMLLGFALSTLAPDWP